MDRIAVICARGASKGLAGKNIRPLGGRPLIAHTIVQAREAGLFTCVAVGSDSDRILDCGKEWGADLVIKRPADLADDFAPKLPAIRHCATVAEERTGHVFDTIIDLAVTSPLRTTEDIAGAVEMLERDGVANIVSATPARQSPYFSIVETDEAGRISYSKSPPTPLVRRQDAPPSFDLNGAVYVWTRHALFADDDRVLGPETRLFIMPAERSLDIDTELDFKIAELLMARRNA